MFNRVRILSMATAWAVVFSFGAQAQTDESASKELQAQVYARAFQLKDRLIDDYAELLVVYYEYKRKSADPNAFANPHYSPERANDPRISATIRQVIGTKNNPTAAEFSVAIYDEFKTQLDADPRLKENSYVRQMKTYRVGEAADIFQRVDSYTLDSLSGLSGKQKKQLGDEIAVHVKALAMKEADETFSRVSAEAGYPENKRRVSPQLVETRLASFKHAANELIVKSIRLKKELQAIGFTPSFSGRSSQGRSFTSSCPSEFGKLTK